MIKKIERLIVFVVLAGLFFNSGCGIVGLVGTPSQYEKEIPAEYDLTKQKDKKILVLVKQPSGFRAKTNLHYYLTEAVRDSLVSNVKVKPKYVLSYKVLSEFRSNRSDFSSLSPEEVGKALGADIVLLVEIRDFQLNEVVGSGYYNGSLSVQAAVYDANDGKEWEGRNVDVGFDTGERGQEGAAMRLVNACAYCITRYLYNCPEYKFRISDEGKNTGWGD
ncbi:MAG: hypothetical protein PHQ35_00140 [Phycisphaerae bacterium]|nr:hypothetical protein [Phycisphaerae bacterium]MDD5381637.1 hypothetical protein [Phycisphaerae bacterium]